MRLMELTNKIITKQQTENRKKVNIEDIELFTNLITEYKYKFVENIKLIVFATNIIHYFKILSI